MELVNFLAQFWGFSLVIISLALLLRPENIEHITQLIEEHRNVVVFGVINVMLGVAFILMYNVWDSSWKVMITILAWLILIRGIICLFFPDIIKKGVEKIKRHKDWFSYLLVVFVALGCSLIYFGMSV